MYLTGFLMLILGALMVGFTVLRETYYGVRTVGAGLATAGLVFIALTYFDV